MSYAVRPDVVGLSPLGRARALRNVGDRTEPVYGVAMHSTGSGIIAKALAAGRDPLGEVVAYYSSPATPYFGHYAIDYDGVIVQIADEHERAQHVGFPPEQRQAFLDG